MSYEGFKIFPFIGSYGSTVPPRQILFNIQTHDPVGMWLNMNIYLFAHDVHGLHDAPWHETVVPSQDHRLLKSHILGASAKKKKNAKGESNVENVHACNPDAEVLLHF